MTDKLRTIICASLTAAVLVAAMLLPLAFRTGGEQEPAGAFGFSQRAALFADYWSGDGETEAEPIEKPAKRDVEACRLRMQELVERYTLDRRLEEAEPTGSTYVKVSGPSGELRLCRMWLQAQGDWQNWLDVCFDMDTGDVYYFYFSGECLFNGNDYLDGLGLNRLGESLDPEYAASQLSRAIGYDLQYLDWSGQAADSARAVFTAEGSAVCYELKCIYYDATLVDVKICCV